MNIVEILDQQGVKRPDQPAIIDRHRGRERIHSFGQLAQDSARTAALLGAHGIRAGDVVLVLHPMAYELYTVLLAIFRIGAVAMFLDPSAGRGHIRQCCEIARPKALIASDKAQLLRLVSLALRRIPVKFSPSWFIPGAVALSRARHLPPLSSIAPVEAEAPALLTFTSGSTGRPKAAERSHGFLVAQHRAIEDALDLQAGQVDLTTLPIFLLANLASGVTSVVPQADLRHPGRVEAAPVIRQMQRLGVTRSAGSPAFFLRLIEYCEQQQLSLTGLRRIDTGGAPVFPTLLERLQRAAPNAKVVAVYGSTEAEPMCHVAYDDMQERDIQAMRSGSGLLTGTPVPQAEIAILPDEFGVPIGPFSAEEFSRRQRLSGEIGEIVVSGEHVLKGYLHGEGDEETKFEVEGRRWHRTGDAGYFDKQQRMWLLGRCTARIDDAKGILYPFSVECAAQFVPGVSRSAMVAHQGERILLIESKQPHDLTAIQDRLKWASLDRVEQISEIPVDKRHNAKIDYTRVYELLIAKQ